jgi:hypothetical protein
MAQWLALVAAAAAQVQKRHPVEFFDFTPANARVLHSAAAHPLAAVAVAAIKTVTASLTTRDSVLDIPLACSGKNSRVMA